MTVTRFAPSPTGYLHIGGARTALFSYLHARHHGGKFLLRVEDTDAERNNEEAAAAILSGLKWLGLDWDDDVVYQSQRRGRHREVAEMLLASGHAYIDYTSREEEEKIRAEWAEKNPKRPYLYRASNFGRFDPNFSPPEREHPHTIRFRMPDENIELVTDDAVQGTVKVQSRVIEDFVLLRSDGTPTFLLACTVDDHDMGVTDVIRGDDHLNNAFKQNLISQALGWTPPRYAHVPLIHNSEGKKFSKRDGAATIEDYDYFEADAVFNYLLRLGWGHGDQEIFSREEAISLFDIAKVGRNPARFDEKKLTSINAHYVGQASAEQLGVRDHPILPEVKKRAKFASDVQSMMVFLNHAPLRHSEMFNPLRHEIAQALDGEWTHDALDAALRDFAETKGMKMGEVCGIVRVCLTGLKQHIGVHDLLLALGKDESLARLNR